jgi:tripartite-type tricarboxylate transporter receptor subunit TctC
MLSRLRRPTTRATLRHTRRWSLAALGAYCAICLTANPAASQEPNFAGKTVKLILGQAAGGGADASARLVAAYIGKFLPGNPVVVVQNMPGANGIVASNHLTHQVAPDGLTFFAGSASQVVAAAEKNPNAKYDPAVWEFVGAVQNPGTVLVAAKTAIPRLTDPKMDPVVMAQVGVARPGALFTIWGKEFLGWNVRQVTGYRGSTDIDLAIQRGEAEMMGTGGINVIGPMVASGKFVGVAQNGLYTGGKFVRRKSFPDTPTMSELLAGKLNSRELSALNSWLNAAAIGKFYALPPKTPAPIVAAYREAFLKMDTDPEFQEKAKAVLDPDYDLQSGEDIHQLIKNAMSQSDEDRAYLTQLRVKNGLSAETRGD